MKTLIFVRDNWETQLANAGEMLLKRIAGFDVTVAGTVLHIGPIQWKEGR